MEPEVAELRDAAASYLATLERLEMYNYNPPLPKVKEQMADIMRRLNAALEMMHRARPELHVINMPGYLIIPTFKDGKVLSVRTVAHKSILNFDVPK